MQHLKVVLLLGELLSSMIIRASVKCWQVRFLRTWWITGLLWQVNSQVITQAEACAALLARRNLTELISQRRVVFSIDKEASRFSLIKSASPSLSLIRLTQLFHHCSEVDFELDRTCSFVC